MVSGVRRLDIVEARSNCVEGIISLTGRHFQVLTRLESNSYLKNNCGLSLESALEASKSVHLETPEKPDCVIAVLKNHGFSKPQITRLINKRPALLTSDVEGTVLPKLDNVLKSDEKIFRAVKHYPRLMDYSISTYDVLSSNINTLLDNGVAECNIVSTLCLLPTTFVRSPKKFNDMVEEAKDIGLNPSKPMFVVALSALSSMSKLTWKRKIEVFKKLGWSEEEVLEACRRYPSFMRVSEDKLVVTMDFLMNEMGFSSSVIAKRPQLLSMSIEKKIVPRGLFALDLLSKGVIKHIYLSSLFGPSDHVFIENFIRHHKSEASQLLKLYHEKLDLSKNWRVDGCKLQHL
ncbi:Mitochondrial transcription termination factor family protein, putative isoform 2 [Hibiscus syriacus]|uniref:Mitochondrial transcription termination factor family protein, putative isoform 2 n=1 Tax=Hibiscus syriacus TaxID=106335 RepID=A0A6A3C8C4_HIBSY|nr:Mitochondrial transcription termination factor family protein, putative isoform 2 [Hibiscus syriacus]